MEYGTKRKTINFVILLCLFMGWFLFNGTLLILHEPWRDEANVWLMAKELSPVRLFQEIKYQGHPCLWYLIVMPFAKLGLPFRTIGIISLAVMAVSAGIFLWKAPLHNITKAVCLFSPVFTYFYSDIARNYCLIALILILLAWQFPLRNEHCVQYGLLLGLLVQADTIAIVQVGMISAMWFLENVWQGLKTRSTGQIRKMLTGVWIPAASLGLWVLQFYQVSDSPQFQVRGLNLQELFEEIRNFAYGIMIRMTGRGESFCLLFFVSSAAILLLLSVKLRNGWGMVVLISSFLFQAFFSAVIYQLHFWHFISLGFVFIWTIWTLYVQVKGKVGKDRVCRAGLWGLEILLMILSICMFVNWNSEKETSSLSRALRGVYSDGGNAAEYIKENIPSEELIISADIPMTSTVLAYLDGYEFYYAGSGRKESYADWSEEQCSVISYQELLNWCRNTFPDKQICYILWTQGGCIYDTEELKTCEIVYRTKEQTVRGEDYTVYKVYL